MLELPSHNEISEATCMLKDCHTLKWGTCSYSNTEQQYSIITRQRTSIGFELAVRDGTEAGGLVAPLPGTAYFDKLAKLFGGSLPQQGRPSPFVF